MKQTFFNNHLIPLLNNKYFSKLLEKVIIMVFDINLYLKLLAKLSV